MGARRTRTSPSEDVFSGSFENRRSMEILHQLGDLVIGSIPTMILFVLLVLAYWVVLYRPLMRTLVERRERTQGAVAKAADAIAAADAKSQEYEARLRAARADIFRHREQLVQQ